MWTNAKELTNELLSLGEHTIVMGDVVLVFGCDASTLVVLEFCTKCEEVHSSFSVRMSLSIEYVDEELNEIIEHLTEEYTGE